MSDDVSPDCREFLNSALFRTLQARDARGFAFARVFSSKHTPARPARPPCSHARPPRPHGPGMTLPPHRELLPRVPGGCSQEAPPEYGWSGPVRLLRGSVSRQRRQDSFSAEARPDIPRAAQTRGCVRARKRPAHGAGRGREAHPKTMIARLRAGPHERIIASS